MAAHLDKQAAAAPLEKRDHARNWIGWKVQDDSFFTKDNLRQFIHDEVVLAVKDEGATSPNALRRVVREEVVRSVEDRGLVEGVLARSLSDEKWVGKIEVAVLQFLKKDFDKVLALGADAYHFRRWDDLQSEFSELKKAVGMEHRRDEVSHTRDLVGNVREKHQQLSDEVVSLRERLDLATKRVQALEGHSQATHESFERQKALHFKILEGQADELKDGVKMETSKLAESFWKELERVGKDIQALHSDRSWLHRQEEALSSRCRDLEKRLEDGTARTKEAKGEVRQGMAELSARIDQIHANLRQLYEDLRASLSSNNEATATRMRLEMSEQITLLQATLADNHLQHKEHQQRHDALAEELRVAQAEHSSSGKVIEGRVQQLIKDHTTTLGADLAKKNAENKVLHEKLQTAVLKGYEAVESQFREVLGEQITAVKADMAQTLALHQSNNEEIRTEVAKGHMEVERKLREALHERILHLGAATEEGHGRIQFDLEVQLEALRDEMSEVKGSEEAREAHLQQALQQHASTVATQLESLDMHKELAEERHAQVHVAMQGRDEGVHAKLNEVEDRLVKHGEATARENAKAMSKETAHKLHAVAYSLLEVIGEVELTGTSAEVRAKRSTLHNRLCDRLGASRSWNEDQTEALAASQLQQGSEFQLRRLSQDTPADAESLHLPPVHKPSAPSTPKPQRSPVKFSDSLREIRSLRLADYSQGSEWSP